MTTNELQQEWQVPAYKQAFWDERTKPWCIIIPVINEGERINNLLQRMHDLQHHRLADIIIVDGGSTDGSLDPAKLRELGVRGLICKTGPGKLSAQLRCAYAFAVTQAYDGVITIDGNDKDDPAAIPDFIADLRDGIDFVQASRYIDGGESVNVPLSRDLAIRLIHAPVLSWSSGFHWTDTTQGFRAYSKQLLCDPKVAVFRDVFQSYELLAYLSHIAPRLGYRCKERPTARRYPEGEVPTKISAVRGNLQVLLTLFRAASGAYTPRP